MTANFGGEDVVPLLGVIAGCHSSVLWLGGRTSNFGGVDVVPLLAAIAGRKPLFHIFLSIFRATNFTQTPKKTAMKFVLSFLQTLHCFLH